jgi:phospholipid/cholesterol/gamma-HCH transport system ATP-binding protein
VIEINNIRKSFEGKEVLKGITTTFEAGKTNLVIGSSGHGKSVLMKCMVGLIVPDDGHVVYDNRDFTNLPYSEMRDVRREIGMLFQGSALFDSMTIEQNVMFPLQMFTNMTKAEIQQRTDFCLDRVNLAGRNKLMPSECSGGMQKRVGIARAIAMNPRYLFCDEPNSGLDPKTSIVIDNLIRDLTQEYNITTVVITHDMNSVMEIGDHILFIHQGKKWWQGDRHSIIHANNPEIESFVYASAFMKDIRAQLQKKA